MGFEVGPGFAPGGVFVEGYVGAGAGMEDQYWKEGGVYLGREVKMESREGTTVY